MLLFVYKNVNLLVIFYVNIGITYKQRNIFEGHKQFKTKYIMSV